MSVAVAGRTPVTDGEGVPGCGDGVPGCGDGVLTCGDGVLTCGEGVLTCGEGVLACIVTGLGCGDAVLTWGDGVVVADGELLPPLPLIDLFRCSYAIWSSVNGMGVRLAQGEGVVGVAARQDTQSDRAPYRNRW